MERIELTYKICIFGDKRVGKTTLTNRFLTDQFDESIKSTLGAAIHIKFLEVENLRVVLQIWDFGGEDSYKFLLPAYARGSFGGIFVFDVTREETLENIGVWLDVFREGLDFDEKDNPILMVGAKADLAEGKEVHRKDVEELIKKYRLLGFIECSSKTGQNVELVFIKLVRKIIDRAGIIHAL